jgi:oligopeptide/dipeptide ABC transporter ATP-binding protein
MKNVIKNLAMNPTPVLRIEDLVLHFHSAQRRRFQVLNGVSLTLHAGETLGLVGESGSGKTTIGRAALRLYDPSSGRIEFEGQDVTRLKGEALKKALRSRSAMVFQNPATCLNPYMRLGDLLLEPLLVHNIDHPRERERQVSEMLDRVGLGADMRDRYPHELSGGQRQRVGIARALMLEPSLIVADEPTASLDVSVQAQVVNLLQDLQAERGLAYLFISHDLALVRHISHRIAVMYLGNIVEIGDADQVFDAPLHPYTACLASMRLEPEHKIIPVGDLPSPLAPPSGCAFHPRCPIARDLCRSSQPTLQGTEASEGRHAVACHFPGELRLAADTARIQAPAAPLAMA